MGFIDWFLGNKNQDWIAIITRDILKYNETFKDAYNTLSKISLISPIYFILAGVQPYEGVVISMRHGGLNETITVRRIFQGIGVERIFMLHSPQVASIKVERRGKVRRAKLFYLRERVGKATRVKQRFDR